MHVVVNIVRSNKPETTCSERGVDKRLYITTIMFTTNYTGTCIEGGKNTFDNQDRKYIRNAFYFSLCLINLETVK